MMPLDASPVSCPIVFAIPDLKSSFPSPPEVWSFINCWFSTFLNDELLLLSYLAVKTQSWMCRHHVLYFRLNILEQ